MTYHRSYALAGVIVLLVLEWLVPLVFLGLTVLVLLITIGLVVFKVTNICMSGKLSPKHAHDPTYQPFVSIHMACCNEPSKTVGESLEYLARLDYPNYEVIIIHNNNQDRELQSSLELKCKKLGSRFHFLHEDHISGYKSGALNYARKFMFKEAKYLAIIDADYHVMPNFLKENIGFFIDPKVAIVQIPQDYRDSKISKRCLALEYQSFFSIMMNTAEKVDAVTFTGTMGILWADIFESKNIAWNEKCITEDTEIGIRIHAFGYKAIYIDKAYGNGIMPLSYASLREQRLRWGYGNAQIIAKDFLPIMFSYKLKLSQKMNFIGQLSYWLHPELLLAIMYLMAAFMQLSHPNNTYLNLATYLIITSLLASLVGNFMYFVVGLSFTRGVRFTHSVRAFFVHCGLLTVMSISWLRFLFGKPLDFRVTPKANHISEPKTGYRPELTVIILLAIGLIVRYICVQDNFLEVVIVSAIIILILACIVYLNNQFKVRLTTSTDPSKKQQSHRLQRLQDE